MRFQDTLVLALFAAGASAGVACKHKHPKLPHQPAPAVVAPKPQPPKSYPAPAHPKPQAPAPAPAPAGSYGNPNGSYKEKALYLHNKARGESGGVGNLGWHSGAESQAYAAAQEMCNQRSMHHNHHDGYGQNIAAGTGSMVMDPASYMKMWVDDEKSTYWNQYKGSFGEPCGHYTQVVWKGTTGVGCASVTCGNGWSYAACNYYPPGNVRGQFNGNVL